MESRKVQRSGKSSFVVSLPAPWVKAYGIRKNAAVSVALNPDGTLTIYPKEAKERAPQALSIPYRGEREKTAVLRRMIGAYIAGFEAMELRPEPAGYESAISLVSEFTSMTVGQEVVEESQQKIVINNILRPSELPIEKALLRMANISKKMFSDAVLAIESPEAAGGMQMQQMERDTDRLWRLVARRHNLFLRFPSSAAGEGMTLPRAHFYFLTARLTERVADHSVMLYNYHGFAQKAGGREPGIQKVAEFGRKAAAVFGRATDAVFRLDIGSTNSIIDDADALEAHYDQVFMADRRLSSSVQIGAMKQQVKRVSEYSADICEYLIDYGVTD
ncbi:MAG: phosphate uptake regulator PhoU [Candidatus Micrarchaeota archaeon]|nr:phosphate uptake regulator PhoU [Candidatus Micrarchaeota archaeon]